MPNNTSRRPNILLIFTDQHRLSACSPYGDTPCITPNMERLAAEGTRFENAYTACPVCTPARGTIMTGLFPHSHGMATNIYNEGCRVDEIPDDPALLSRRLESAGYQLGYSGKWHLGRKTLPRDVGFRGHNCPGHGNGGFGFDAFNKYLDEHGMKHEVKEKVRGAGVYQQPLEGTVPYFLADNTINLVDQFAENDQPFFIWHNFWGPHAPYFCTQEFLDLYEDVDIPPWPNYEWSARDIPGPHQGTIHPLQQDWDWPDWEILVRHYYAFTTMIDSQIGRMLDHLERTGIADNTVVLFVADHGETLGSHGGLMNKGFHHFEETHRIPFIVRDPRRPNDATVREQLVSLTDVYPTILSLADAGYDPSSVHGRTLNPLIDGTASDWRDDVVTEFNGVDNAVVTLRTLRWGPYKYGFNASHRDELYDLEEDPLETHNLIDQKEYEDVIYEARERLYDWMSETCDRAKHLLVRKHAGQHRHWIEGSPGLAGNPIP